MLSLAADILGTLALALVNLNSASANVTITVFDEHNTQIDKKTLDPLTRNRHLAEFLTKSLAGRFAGIDGVRGRVEIESDIPILGTALTYADNLYSSLPLTASPYTYSYTTSISGIGLGGQIDVWHEGPYIKGYLRVTVAAGNPLDAPGNFLFHGVFKDGTLRAAGTGNLVVLGNLELGVDAVFKNFSLTAASATGTLKLTNLTNNQSESSQISLSKIK